MSEYHLTGQMDEINKQGGVNLLFASKTKSADFILTDAALAVDRKFNRIFSEAAKTQKFKAEPSKILFLTLATGSRLDSFIVAGVGELDKLQVDGWMNAVAAGVGKAKAVHAGTLTIHLDDRIVTQIGNPEILSRTVEAAELSQYEFLHHKSDSSINGIETINIAVSGEIKHGQELIRKSMISADAVRTARNLVNEPSSVTTPAYLAHFAENIAKNDPLIKTEILGPEKIAKLGMNAFLGIAQGSDEEPRFIRLDYNPDKKPAVCIIGKGITFDSGGLSLKPESGMETMKCDMAGAAAVLGIFSVISKLKPDCRVIGLIAATENMPSGKAIKPGDIVKALNGKSIEVANTDAEGRVILADAVSYAAKYVKPDEIIDLATLTGACMVALGEDIAGLFTNRTDHAAGLMQSANITGEKLWELPLVTEYRELLTSRVADIRNVSKTRYGGAITGALFIADFVPPDLPWTHLDIAGPAFIEKDQPMTPVGGSGFGVRMLLSYLSALK
jgi:leucyl aminopeptidase